MGLMQLGEIMDDVDQDKIEQGDITAKQKHGNDDDERRISELLIAAESFFFRFPRPRSFLQFDLYLAEKILCFGKHDYFATPERAARWVTGKIKSNIEHRPSNIQNTRQEGLEPPTDGFGDRYSTN